MVHITSQENVMAITTNKALKRQPQVFSEGAKQYEIVGHERS